VAPPGPLLRDPRWDVPTLMAMWRRGALSNLEYVLWLNLFAGRRLGDRRAHAFVPWVIDFTAAPLQEDLAGGKAGAWRSAVRRAGAARGAVRALKCATRPHSTHPRPYPRPLPSQLAATCGVVPAPGLLQAGVT
jgi:hypothetical protein